MPAGGHNEGGEIAMHFRTCHKAELIFLRVSVVSVFHNKEVHFD